MCPNIDNSSINKHSSPCTNMTIKHNATILLIATMSSRFSSLEFNVKQGICRLHTPPFECKRIIMVNKKKLKLKIITKLNKFILHPPMIRFICISFRISNIPSDGRNNEHFDRIQNSWSFTRYSIIDCCSRVSSRNQNEYIYFDDG